MNRPACSAPAVTLVETLGGVRDADALTKVPAIAPVCAASGGLGDFGNRKATS